ncbi:MAG: GspE/PulE family protein [Patescibacteria group bacterium]
MTNKELLDKIVSADLLSAQRADKLLAEAEVTHQSVEDLLYDRRLVEEIEVARIKSKLLGIPFKKVNINNINDEVLGLLPEETVTNYKVVPLGKEDKMLVVGLVHPDDRRAQDALRYIAKQKKMSLGVYLITPSDLELVMRRYSPLSSQIEAAVRSIQVKPGRGEGTKKIGLEQMSEVSEEAPIIKIVASTLKEAVSIGASDIHIEPQRTRLRFRFRIDGILREEQSLPAELHSAIISRVKILSNLKIDENRVPQDGRFRTEIFGREIDFRVSSFPTPSGEKVAIRVLDPKVGLKQLDELGVSGQSEAIIKKGIEEPFGMILITGPTGSGKTTTLYALMQKLNKEDVNVVSLEDPVEYTIEGVNQSQVRPEIGYTFASGLRQILRQDPDVMMVGEVRDRETADLAVHSALTGHIVLSTLHTNNAVGVIPRLIDMDVDAFLLPSVLNLMVSQRLVSKLCQECKQQESPSETIQGIIEKEVGGMVKGPYQVWKALGCKACNNKGRKGRVGLFEVLQMTPQLADIINTQPTENKILEETRRQKMVTLRQDGILKALEGLVSIEEVLRETAAST